MEDYKHQILEPLTSISRIISLSFYPIGTKIAIRNHKIILCEPDKKKPYFNNTILQGFDRFINRDSRKDIYVLNHVINNFIEWYVVDYKQKYHSKSDIQDDESEVYPHLINLIKYLIVGLKRLQQTYKTGNVVYTLQYYILILISIVNDTFDESILYSHEEKESSYDILDMDEHDKLKYSTIFDREKLKTFWNATNIKSLCIQFEECFINKFITLDDIKDTTSNQQIDFDNTSIKSLPSEYTLNKILGIELPIPKNKNNAIVKGTLVGINSILSTMDSKFTHIIEKSVKGTK
jgi:hypothetical protein